MATTPQEAPTYALHREAIEAPDSTLPDDVHALNLAGYELAHVQVIPSGGADPSIEVMFWSDGAGTFISAAPKLATAGQGVDTPYEVTVSVAGRRMFVAITDIAAGSCDIHVAGFSR